MITALLVLVFAVVLVGWLMATVVFVAIMVSMTSQLLNRSSALSADSASPESGWRARDAQFLRDLGIRP
jgi:hypothetical protein